MQGPKLEPRDDPTIHSAGVRRLLERSRTGSPTPLASFQSETRATHGRGTPDAAGKRADRQHTPEGRNIPLNLVSAHTIYQSFEPFYQVSI